MEREDTLKNIQNRYQSLSKGHKKLADYVLTNYDKVVFMTVNELSTVVGISESTVVRFAHSLGYSGYPSFQKNLQYSTKSRLTTLQRFEHTSDAQEDKDVIREIMIQDIENINSTINQLNTEKIKSIAKKIKAANNVYVIGLRRSKVLAEYLTFYLKFIHSSVILVPNGANDIYDEVINANNHDIVIAISFPRYSKNTFDLVDLLRERRVPVIGITDSYHSPLANRVTDILTAEFNIETFVDSLTAPMSLINALIIGLSLDDKQNLERKFNQLEAIWKKNNVYL